MSAQCYEHRFGYCTNAKTCFNVHFWPILAERRVLLGTEPTSNKRSTKNTLINAFYGNHKNVTLIKIVVC